MLIDDAQLDENEAVTNELQGLFLRIFQMTGSDNFNKLLPSNSKIEEVKGGEIITPGGIQVKD